jgi:hypothetical protein
MSDAILCHGCGQQVPIPAGHTRNKMQCPQCGVMLELPAARKKPAPAAPPPPLARRASEGARRPPPTKPVAPEPDEDEAITNILLGGESPLSVQPDEPAAAPAPPPRAPAPEPEPESYVSSNDDDGLPYAVSGGLDRPCPNCEKRLAPGTALCPGCGFNLRTGKKAPKKTYEPLARHWETGLAPASRIGLFALGLALTLAGGIAGLVLGDSVFLLVASPLGFVVMAGFLLGTWDAIDLTRDKRGKVRLTKTWRVYFVPQAAMEIPVYECEEIVQTMESYAGFFEWLILFTLLPFGIIPGVLWWYHAIHSNHYTVALARDNGYPVAILYRGLNERLMKEIAAAVREATGMPVRLG